MIQSFTITNDLSESLSLELSRPELSGLAVLGVEGLGPPKANINVGRISGFDGSFFNSARAQKRNIVFRLSPYKTSQRSVEDARQMINKYFPLKKKIRVVIKTDNREVDTYGYVESNEPEIFSENVVNVVSVICPNAYLYDVYDMVTVFSSVDGAFEFPFSNESTSTPLLEFSTLTYNTEKTIVYPGEASVGMVIHIHAIGAASDITITDSDTLETLSIDSTKLSSIVGSDISSGDDIYISTVRGNKYASLIRSGTTYNILNSLGKNPTWFQLDRGDNTYAYSAASGLSNLEFQITNPVAYESV